MRIVLIGAPGAGKGTQAMILSKQLKIPKISTGDIFRDNLKNNTVLGEKVKVFLEKGLLVPDEITISLIKERLQMYDCKGGYILDGFPRTLTQAKSLEDIIQESGMTIDAVINFNIADEIIIKRLSGRRVCLNCGNIYHIVSSSKLQNENCENCNTTLVQRDDDQETIIRRRLNAYHQQTKPLVLHYQQTKILFEVDATRSIEDVVEDIASKIRNHSDHHKTNVSKTTENCIG